MFAFIPSMRCFRNAVESEDVNECMSKGLADFVLRAVPILCNGIIKFFVGFGYAAQSMLDQTIDVASNP